MSRWPGPRRLGRAWLAVAISLVCLLMFIAGCDSPSRSAAPGPSSSLGPLDSTPGATSGACSEAYAAPDPRRPVTVLAFDLAADRKTVTGTESVRFTPDLAVTEVVFRLWPNGMSAPAGTSVTVTKATVAGAGAFTTASLGARSGTQGTLLTIPLGRASPAGAAIIAELEFTLRLPPPDFERWGSTGATAWWGSGQPLLAWERGRGWQRQPAVQFPSEAAVSEAASIDLTVTAPAADTVLMSGGPEAPRPIAGGRRQWHSTSDTARDVSVSVGRFSTRKATIEGVDVIVGVSAEVDADVDELLTQTRRSIIGLSKRFGPVPYPSLSIAALPGISTGGIEFPSSIMVGSGGWDIVVPHETAHEYFYGMIGDNQARDPWLDEAFATFSEALVNDTTAKYLPALALPGPVGSTMQSWGDDQDGYYGTIYYKGAAALLTARQRAGPAAFDAALRCYLSDNAWTVATPEDLARALARLPAALAVLHRARAL